MGTGDVAAMWAAPDARSYEGSCCLGREGACCWCWECGLSMLSEGKSVAREKLSKPPGLMLRCSGSGSCWGVGMECDCTCMRHL